MLILLLLSEYLKLLLDYLKLLLDYPEFSAALSQIRLQNYIAEEWCFPIIGHYGTKFPIIGHYSSSMLTP